MLVLQCLIVLKLKTNYLTTGIYCMQLSILANGRSMRNLSKLLLSQKSKVTRQVFLALQKNVLKRSRLNIPGYGLVLFMLSLPAQALYAEGVATQLPSVVNANEQDNSQKNSSTGQPNGEVASHENPVLANEITAIITAKQQPYLQRADFQNRADDLEALYKIAGYKLLWLANPQADKNRADALNLLENAATYGLNPASYDIQSLQQRLPPESAFTGNDYKQLALYDTAVSLSLLRFLHDLHYGRVNPKAINFDLKSREKKLIDLPTLINSNASQNSIAQLPDLVEPKLKQYQKLKQVLAKYQAIAKNAATLNLVVTAPVKPGENLPDAKALERFLVPVGDLSKDENNASNKEANSYTHKLASGVKKFQSRHGIDPNGVLSKSTVEAINVPISQRVTQIELAMERLRWLPEMSAGATIIVNIPAFQLWAFDDVNEFDANMPNLRVVVGQAMKNETPVLMAEMRFIDFMPYWNVPYNIVKKEILPKLIKNPGYLAGENMELVSTFGNETKAVAFSTSLIPGLSQGSLRIRQRPGKKNALGKVKFMFPNKNDVYLHDTPSRSLFSRSRRDFSHGCVRVQNPGQLAEFVLKNQLSKEAINEAMQTEKNRRVILKKSIPVVFFYSTSFVDQHDNLDFYADIYGYDSVLQAELKKSVDLSDQDIFAPPPPPLPPPITQPTTALNPVAPINNSVVPTNNPEIDKSSDKEP